MENLLSYKEYLVEYYTPQSYIKARKKKEIPPIGFHEQLRAIFKRHRVKVHVSDELKTEGGNLHCVFCFRFIGNTKRALQGCKDVKALHPDISFSLIDQKTEKCVFKNHKAD